MRKIATLIAIAMVVAALMPAAVAQGNDQKMMSETGPPPILHIGREEIKPGKQFAHEKNETAWTQALVRSKYEQGFLAAESVTGPTEVLWFYGFPTMAAFEADYKAGSSASSLASISMQYGPQEADLVAGSSDIIARFRGDLSYNPDINVGEYRYFNINTTRVRPGHNNDYIDFIKTVNEARKSTNSEAHVAVYQVISGAPNGTFLIFTPRKSLAEMDASNEAMTQAMNAVQDKVNSLVEKSIISATTAIYAFNPRMSKPTEAIAKADPKFWKPKMTMAAAAPSQPAAKAAAPAKNKP